MNMDKIQSVKLWLKTVIIAYQICPFAQREFENHRIYYRIDEANTIEESAHILIEEARRLDQNPEIETTLIIYAHQFADFDDFLNYIDLADELLKMQNYEGIYQIASFHPEYCFADIEPEDAANYTNRSPYPIVHLIRESSIEKALAVYPDPDKIFQRNIALTRELGLAKMQALLNACRT